MTPENDESKRTAKSSEQKIDSGFDVEAGRPLTLVEAEDRDFLLGFLDHAPPANDAFQKAAAAFMANRHQWERRRAD